jgi:hypothetical protein
LCIFQSGEFQPASGGVMPWERIHEIKDPTPDLEAEQADLIDCGGVSRLHSRRGIFTVIGPSPWMRSPRRRFVAL